jgi:hypothetical protein
MKKLVFKEKVIPEVIIFSDEDVRNISKIYNEEYIINEFSVVLNDNNIIEKILLENGKKHPNCCRESNEFCKSEFWKNKKFDENLTKFEIRWMISIWNFRSFFFKPDPKDYSLYERI